MEGSRWGYQEMSLLSLPLKLFLDLQRWFKKLGFTQEFLKTLLLAQEEQQLMLFINLRNLGLGIALFLLLLLLLKKVLNWVKTEINFK